MFNEKDMDGLIGVLKNYQRGGYIYDPYKIRFYKIFGDDFPQCFSFSHDGRIYLAISSDELNDDMQDFIIIGVSEKRLDRTISMKSDIYQLYNSPEFDFIHRFMYRASHQSRLDVMIPPIMIDDEILPREGSYLVKSGN